jgi:hypothetical protein
MRRKTLLGAVGSGLKSILNSIIETTDVDAEIALASEFGRDPKATLAGCSMTYAFIRNPAISSMLSCLVPTLGESQ